MLVQLCEQKAPRSGDTANTREAAGIHLSDSHPGRPSCRRGVAGRRRDIRPAALVRARGTSLHDLRPGAAFPPAGGVCGHPFPDGCRDREFFHRSGTGRGAGGVSSGRPGDPPGRRARPPGAVHGLVHHVCAARTGRRPTGDRSAPVNLLLRIALLPVYVWVFMGGAIGAKLATDDVAAACVGLRKYCCSPRHRAITS